MISPDKRSKMQHYSTRELKEFVQIDGFLKGDEVMGMDADGHSVCGGITSELMHGSDVRILIPREHNRAQVIGLLRKALEAIEGGFMERIKTGLDRDGRPKLPLLVVENYDDAG